MCNKRGTKKKKKNPVKINGRKHFDNLRERQGGAAMARKQSERFYAKISGL